MAPVITWRKSSHSGTDESACVELAALGSGIGIRDSKDPGAGHLTLSSASFARLVQYVKRGQFNG
ncbi:DUF397 domain-containing protein [Spirillospora sp. NPDC029432]|uniref:DUF397 domain-containing protein n=1 Tax=Spirillospora sp. NPDC029432 TaxID=3154599 RepID=UPI003451518B